MLTNDQMLPNRYGKLATARRTYRRICATLQAGGTVTIATYTQARSYQGAAHTESFRITGADVYYRRNKTWDCFISAGLILCGIRYTL